MRISSIWQIGAVITLTSAPGLGNSTVWPHLQLSDDSPLVLRIEPSKNNELIVTLVNPTPEPQSGNLEIKMGTKLPVLVENDHSLGSWVYGRYDLFVQVDDELLAPSTQRIETRQVVETVRHRIRGIKADRRGIYDSSLNVLTIEVPDLAPGLTWNIKLQVYDGALSDADLRDSAFYDLLYATVFPPLRTLTIQVERLLLFLAELTSSHGIAIILFAVCVRLLTLPVNLWASRRQRDFAAVSTKMDPLIANARSSLKGAAQSERILEIYKQYGVNPISGLLGSVGLFVQIPVLMCVFGVTTESAGFAGVGFWLLDDLSEPDRMLSLGFSIPILGAYLNVLPLILGGCLWVSGRVAGFEGQTTRSGMVLSLMMVLFFYSFASSLVLYWIVVTLARIPEQQLFAKKETYTAKPL